MNGVDVTIANSNTVKKRFKDYLGCEARVVYPPVCIQKYKWISEGSYYLSTARLESYKRVDLIIRSFLSMPHKRLVITSGGSQLKSLRALACNAPNIEFTNWCTQQQLQKLVGNAIATIYLPINEDFGISPVESQAAGKPVIGVAEGGLLETVKHKVTGLLVDPKKLGIESLREAVEKMTRQYALSLKSNCESNSKLFSKEIFVTEMRSMLDQRQG